MLNMTRCHDLRVTTPLMVTATACISTATGSPKCSSTAKVNMVDGYVPPTVVADDTITGRSSPNITSTASTQNSGPRASSARPAGSSLSMATSRAVKPITVMPARNPHSGVPTRGPVSRVSVGSVIGNRTPIRSLWEGTTFTPLRETKRVRSVVSLIRHIPKKHPQ